MSTSPSGARRTDLDWLRVLAILVIFIFHTSRFFDTMDWHVKNARQYDAVSAWTTFAASWIMPLIFVVSAASSYYALRSRSQLTFLRDRALRLGVPLLVGVFSHIALQVYLERLSHHQFAGSFWRFYPHYFDGLYGAGAGNFAFHGLHLWYLLILLILSALFLPLLGWLSGDSGRRAYSRIGDALAAPGAAYLLAIPIIWALLLSRDDSFFLTRAFGGWNLLDHTQFFLYGFVLATYAPARRSVERQRWASLAGGALLIGGLFALQLSGGPLARGWSAQLPDVLFALSGWCWVLAALGFGARYLTRPTPLLSYANEAVLPFYVLHQTVLITVGYFVVAWPIADPLKFMLIGASSFTLIVGIYEYLIRRVGLLRFLFGMRPLPRAPQARALRGAA